MIFLHQGARTQGLLKIEIDLSLRGSIMDFSSTDSLMQEHLTVRRIGNIAQICSNRLYANEDIPVEDIQIISVIIEEFIDAFHHGEELIRHDDSSNSKGVSTRLKWNNRNKEPVARFLKSYAVFVSDHTAKEDTFFQAIQEKNSISEEEDRELLRHYEVCKGQIGGQARIEEMVKLIDYLEGREWMKQQ
jgi:hemerythrin-like domain-containing protein